MKNKILFALATLISSIICSKAFVILDPATGREVRPALEQTLSAEEAVNSLLQERFIRNTIPLYSPIYYKEDLNRELIPQGSEYLLSDGTPRYKIYRKSPYGRK
nr:uncharacterized protein LOC121125704 isoform X2 [Lepeophtheirus salmonis]